MVEDRHEKSILLHLSSFIIPIHPLHKMDDECKEEVISELGRIKNQCDQLKEMIDSY